jgi:hypothetical protein
MLLQRLRPSLLPSPTLVAGASVRAGTRLSSTSVWDVKPVELSFDVQEPEMRGKGCMVICHGLL